MEQVQNEATKAALYRTPNTGTFQPESRSQHSQKKRSRDFVTNGGDNTPHAKTKRGGHNGRGGHTNGNHGRGVKFHDQARGNNKLTDMERKSRKQYYAAKSKLSEAELAECLRTGACINCKKTGHVFRDCKDPKPEV